jgi:A/G-specific adenine glycosylase
MLQRTRADQVAKVYEEFMEKFPSPQSLAKAETDEIEGILGHLGLRHRIPRFIELSRKVSDEYGGEVPSNLEDLMSLPGVGPYVANAVLCFGFGQEVAIVDANVVRVLSRFFGLASSKRRGHTDPLFWQFARQLLPRNKGIQFNEAVLDFAALICRKPPLCVECQVSSMCAYLRSSVCKGTISSS